MDDLFLEYEPRYITKPPGKVLTTYWHTGGSLGCQFKGKFYFGNSMNECLRGDDANMGVDVLAEAGREVRIRRRQDAVSAISNQFQRKWNPTCNGFK